MGSEDKIKNSTPNKLLLGVGGIMVGSAFGYALQRGNVYLPSVIQGQMNFSNFTMLKMFMTASLTSSLTVTFLNHRKIIQIENLPQMYKRNIVGGLIMGAGILFTGSCPGTVLAQVGSGFKGALFTLLGGVVGASLYGYLDKYVNRLLPSKTTGKSTIHDKLGVPMVKVTIPFALMIVSVLYGIESYVPWQKDSGAASSVSIFGSYSNSIWSPYAAGLLIGLLQLPTHLISNGGLGCSSAYVTVGSKVCDTFNCTVDYFKKFNSGPRSIFGPLLNIGIILGAYYSSKTNPAPAFDTLVDSQNYFNHFLGGLVLLLGARIAGGCPSGNGINNMAKFDIGGIISVASLFAGGIATSLILKK